MTSVRPGQNLVGGLAGCKRDPVRVDRVLGGAIAGKYTTAGADWNHEGSLQRWINSAEAGQLLDGTLES